MITAPTGAVDATKAAKRLVGSFAHMRPGDPDTFIESVAAVLSQYPLGVVEECADPRRGVARKLKFLSIAELVEWLDDRLEYYRKTASLVPRPPALPAPEYSAAHRAGMLAKLRELMDGLRARAFDPIDALKRQAKQQAAE